MKRGQQRKNVKGIPEEVAKVRQQKIIEK